MYVKRSPQLLFLPERADRGMLAPMLRHILAVALVVCSVGQRPDFAIPGWSVGRIYTISTKMPLARELEASSPFRASSKLLQDHLFTVEGTIKTILQEQKVPSPGDLLRPCNTDGKGFRRSMHDIFGLLGWPDPAMSCITDFADTTFIQKQVPRYSVTSVYDAIRTRALVIRSRAKAIVAATTGNFSKPDISMDFPYVRGSANCVVQPVGAIRVGPDWHLISQLTNAPILESAQFNRRFIIKEYHRVGKDDEGFHVMRVRRPIRGAAANGTDLIVDDGTTTLTIQQGQAYPAAFVGIFPEKIPAVQDALNKADMSLQQTDDALAPSSIAILMLPLALNLVPLAALTHASTCSLIAYTIISDILSVIPLAIKGVELIIIGSARYRAVTTRVTGASNGSQAISAAAEIWGVECRAFDRVRPIGILFLCMALSFMVLGVMVELVAQRWIVRRRKRIQEDKDKSLLRSGIQEACEDDM